MPLFLEYIEVKAFALLFENEGLMSFCIMR